MEGDHMKTIVLVLVLLSGDANPPLYKEFYRFETMSACLKYAQKVTEYASFEAFLDGIPDIVVLEAWCIREKRRS
jgi:hypothetical protein